jgi:limonene-1,2-epoxide hydrolase
MRRAAALLAMAALAGCGGGSDSHAIQPRHFSDAQVIRGWMAALNAADYVSAASYFAPDALVQQQSIFRLHTRDAAIAFNSSLPCKGRVTETEDEGRTTVATFALRPGPFARPENCDQPVRVRFRIEDGKFKEWRQLPQEPLAPGDVA